MAAKQNIVRVRFLLVALAAALLCLQACRDDLEALPKLPTVYQTQGREAYLIDTALEEEACYKSMLYKPSNFKVINDSLLIIVDRDAAEGGLKKIDLKTGDVFVGAELGDQPGQISYIGTALLHQFNNGDLWVYDTGLRRGSIFSPDLEFKTHFQFTKTFSAGLINDSTIVTIPTSKDTLLQMHRLDGAYNLDTTPFFTMGFGDESLASLRENPLLRYGFIERSDDHLFIDFDFSTMLLKIGDAEIVFKTFEPEGLQFPNTPAGRKPDVAIFPPTTLDIATDQDYVYILFSGKRVTKSMFLEYSIKDDLDELLDEINRSNRVFILDKEDGLFVGEIVLPVQADKIDVTPEHFFVLSTDGNVPSICKYSRPKRWTVAT